MKKYNFLTGEYEEEEIKCDGCGKIIETLNGFRTKYVEDENGKSVLVTLGSCCVGKIHAYNSLSKKIREEYRNRGQIPDSVLAKLPKAPKPVGKSSEAGKAADNFVDKIGRSTLSKTYDGKVKYGKSKGFKA